MKVDFWSSREVFEVEVGFEVLEEEEVDWKGWNASSDEEKISNDKGVRN